MINTRLMFDAFAALGVVTDHKTGTMFTLVTKDPQNN